MFSVSFNNIMPIHEQLKGQIEKLILSGVLEKDSPLPSVRELACELAINPNTVQKSYSGLEAEGITYSVSGKGRFVAVSRDELKSKKAGEELKTLGEVVKSLRGYGFTQEETIAHVKQFYKEETK